MTSIQSVIAPPLSASEFVAVSFENVQTIALQATSRDVWMAYSEGGLQHASSRFKLSTFQTTDGTADSAMVLTFPHAPYSGTLWFASASTGNNAVVHIWSISCGHRMNGGY